jgi:hypothetical protein
MPDVISIIVSFLSGSVGGSIFGALLAHRLTKQRSREARKTDLLAFLRVWEKEIVTDRRTTNAANVLQNVADRFDGDRLQLMAKAIKAAPNFSGKKRSYFDGLVKTITDRPPGSVESADGKKSLLEAIQNLAIFVSKN